MKRILELRDSWQVKDLSSRQTLDAHELLGAGGSDPQPRPGWIATVVPRQVHEILLQEGRIADPTLLGKASACMWVAERDWIYSCDFPYAEPGSKAYLHFKGLDTLVDVYLNGEHVAYHNDMYLPLRVDVTDRLRPENFLALHFHSPHDYINNYTFPDEWLGKVSPNKILRKNNNDFTDYLGAKPYVTPIGVYDRVLLEVVDGIEIVEADIVARLENGYGAGRVTITVEGSGRAAGAELTYVITDPHAAVVAVGTVPVSGDADVWTQTVEAAINGPQLWWPRGYGEQPLYKVSVSVSVDGKKKDEVAKSVGFREIEMLGPFDFTVNKRPVKLWGAQPGPIQGITHRWDNEKSNLILDLAENSNMNAQRIWGACDRYDDEYYNETDRRGILVWQEFFHDYGMYPDTDEYRELCRREAEFQVKRLKHHPSLLMWCGGNECFMGAEYDHLGAEYIGAKIFTEDYRAVCEALDPDRYYHVNSPSGGAFANDPLVGDTHSYTNVWYVPGADYPVMIAEEMRASPPAVKSMVRYFDGVNPWPGDYSGKITATDEYPWPTTWNERTSSQGWSKIPPIELFYDSTDLESAVHKFGAAHAHYMRTILENNRRGKSAADAAGERVCMGHFVYRWNDPWPVIYGSMLDYYTEPFMPYYSVGRAYEPVLLSFEVGNFINFWVVNDSADDVAGTVTVKLFDPKANVFVSELQREVNVGAGQSTLVTNLNEFKQFSRRYVLFAELVDQNNAIIGRSNDFVDIEKHMHFPAAQVELSIEGDVLTVSTDKFARCVELSASNDGEEFGWYFDDNYFDLLPGEKKQVRVLGRHRRGVITARAYYSGLESSVTLS